MKSGVKSVSENMMDQLVGLRKRLDPAINRSLTEHPEMTMNQIAKEHGVSWAWVSRVNREYGAGRKKGAGSPSHPQARAAQQQ